MRRLTLTCLLVVVTPLLLGRQASASPACEAALPRNIDGGVLEANLLDLLQQSETFRQQCKRIAATGLLRVTLRMAMTIDAGGRAQTTIDRYEAGALRAEVTVRFSEDFVELVPHEFEHILEQLDGIVMHDEVVAGRAWMTASGAFETRRAATAGIRAKQECGALAAEAVHMDAGKAPGGRNPIH
jgi:hypothetical protein